MHKGNGGDYVKNKNNSKKEEFLATLSSITPEEVTDLILNNSKIKTLSNVVVRINNKSEK